MAFKANHKSLSKKKNTKNYEGLSEWEKVLGVKGKAWNLTWWKKNWNKRILNLDLLL